MRACWTNDPRAWVGAARIPNLDASKITSGTITSARLPATSDILAYKAVTAEVGGLRSNTITNSYEVIDSNTSISFGVPSSGLFEVELSFYADSVNTDIVLARLVVVANTVDEFASYYSAVTTPSTEGTYMVAKGNSDTAATSPTFWSLELLHSCATTSGISRQTASTAVPRCDFTSQLCAADVTTYVRSPHYTNVY